MWRHTASQHTGHMEGIRPSACKCLTLDQVLFGKSFIASSCISPMLCRGTTSDMMASYRAVHTVCVSVYVEYYPGSVYAL